MIVHTCHEPWDHAIGIDPGETTGLCAIQLAPGSRFTHRLRGGRVLRGQVAMGRDNEAASGLPWWYRESKTVSSIAHRIFAVAEQWGVLDNTHLAIEDFIIRERTTDRSLLSPVRITSGVLAILEEREGIRVFPHFNQASNGKIGVPDPALKKLGFYEPGQGHSNDAARHAILVLRKMSDGK